MRILADENIPFVKELFGELGSVITLAGRNISNDDVKNIDALIVRSVTDVNESLLAGSQVKFVGTCTIGIDHLDQNYLHERHIAFASAPGCNAQGVVQYVFAALAQLRLLDKPLRVGIIGCGNVGGRVYRAMKGAGYACTVYDPFLTADQVADLGAWDTLFDCDVVCVHTPLTTVGPHPTFHMIGASFFSRMKSGALLLNAGRGPVVDNVALLRHFDQYNSNNIQAVLDVWEPEPCLNVQLRDKVSLGTPHIAGYSYEGKTNGSLMIYEALANWLGQTADKTAATLARVKQAAFGEPEWLTADNLMDAILHTYPILNDDKNLRAVSSCMATEFDLLRKHYPQRREFSHYRVSGGVSENTRCTALGFLAESPL